MSNGTEINRAGKTMAKVQKQQIFLGPFQTEPPSLKTQ